MTRWTVIILMPNMRAFRSSQPTFTRRFHSWEKQTILCHVFGLQVVFSLTLYNEAWIGSGCGKDAHASVEHMLEAKSSMLVVFPLLLLSFLRNQKPVRPRRNNLEETIQNLMFIATYNSAAFKEIHAFMSTAVSAMFSYASMHDAMLWTRIKYSSPQN